MGDAGRAGSVRAFFRARLSVLPLCGVFGCAGRLLFALISSLIVRKSKERMLVFGLSVDV